MVTLVDSPGDPLANSYVSLAFSEAFMEQSYGRADWFGLSIEEQTAALIEATRQLDRIFEWHGYPSSDSQSLDWPQDGQYDKFGRKIDSQTIPVLVKNAVCELAYSIFKFGNTATQSSKVDSVKVGPITLNLDPASSERYFETVDFSGLTVFGDYNIKRTGVVRNVKVLR